MVTKLVSSYTNYAEMHIDKEFASSNSRGCTGHFERQVTARALSFTLIVPALLAHTADSLLGLGAALPGLVFNPIRQFAAKRLETSRRVLAQPFGNLLRMINPQANINMYGTRGLITGLVLERLVKPSLESQNPIAYHLLSRGSYVLLALACLVDRCSAAGLALFAVPAALLTLGGFDSINTAAYRALQVSGIVYDLFFCVANLLSPGSLNNGAFNGWFHDLNDVNDIEDEEDEDLLSFDQFALREGPSELDEDGRGFNYRVVNSNEGNFKTIRFENY